MRLAAISTVVLAGAVTAIAPATGVGAGTFTTITTPSHDITYHFNGAPSAANHLIISGTTSRDVTSVDIGCMVLTNSGPLVQSFATGVPVASRAFSTVAVLDSPFITCRLRAVPTGVDPATAYLGSYSGPLLHTYAFIPTTDGTKNVGFEVFSEVGTGIVVASDAAQCGVNGLLTVSLPDARLRAPGVDQECAFALRAANIVRNTASPNATSIRVDGKNAYLPYSVSRYLRASMPDDGLALTLPQPHTTSTFARQSSNGNITVTESSPLTRCDVAPNTYPPTSVSCTTLVSTGVTLKRVLTLIRGDHQVEIRERFVSTDGHKHSVTAQYQFTAPGADTGAPGYMYPRHVNHFVKASRDEIVSGFGSGPATVYLRSDIYAGSTDDQADTIGFTWSRPPARILFSHTSTGLFAMPYSFSVPANGSARIGFAESEAPYTADVKKLATKAQSEV